MLSSDDDATAAPSSASPCTSVDDVAVVGVVGTATGQMLAPACADCCCPPRNQTGDSVDATLFTARIQVQRMMPCTLSGGSGPSDHASRRPNLHEIITRPLSVTSLADSCTPATRMSMFTGVAVRGDVFEPSCWCRKAEDLADVFRACRYCAAAVHGHPDLFPLTLMEPVRDVATASETAEPQRSCCHGLLSWRLLQGLQLRLVPVFS